MLRYRADNMPLITENKAETLGWRGYHLQRWRHGPFRWSERSAPITPTQSRARAGDYDGDAEGDLSAAFSYAVLLGVRLSPTVLLSRTVWQASNTDALVFAIRSLTKSSILRESLWQAVADTSPQSPSLAYTVGRRGLNCKCAIRVVRFCLQVLVLALSQANRGTFRAVVAYIRTPQSRKELTQLTEFLGMAEGALGHRLDDRTRRSIRKIQTDFWRRQEQLVRILDLKVVTPEEYLDRFNALLKTTMDRMRVVLGEERFNIIFGEVGRHPEGLVERSTFMDAIASERASSR